MLSKRYLTVLFALLFAAIATMGAACTASAAAASAAPADVWQKADALYAKRYDLKNVQEALELVSPFLEAGNYEALWRAARCTYWLGHKAKGKDNRLPLFDKGKALAERATKANSNKPEGFYWIAANIGKAGLDRGILNSLMNVKPMKAALDRVLAIDPSYSDAHRVLADLYAKVPGWPLSIGDSKKAVAHAEAALKAKPLDIRYNRSGAEAYLDAKNPKAAKGCLQTIVEAPLSVEEPDDDKLDKEWAADELKKL